MAGLGWFAHNGEPATTQALAMLLEDAVLRDAIVTHLSHVTGTDLPHARTFEAEAVQEDQSQPDLRGIDCRGRPVVVVEAKFFALLRPGQVGSYLVAQARRLGTDASGALLLLVPEAEVAADTGDSFSTQSFLTDARNNLADLRKDVSDAQSALAEGRAVGLGWNFAEIAFNSGQLGALTAPDSIATEWDAAIVEVNAGLDAATLGYENDSISEMETGLARVSAAADTLAGLIDRV
jgi:hypothetical protein